MEVRQSSFEAIGTQWNVQVHTAITDNAWSELLTQLHARIEIFDTTYSRFRPDSLITTMWKQAGSYDMPADAYKMLAFYEQLYAVTKGSVTPLIGQTMVDAGYDATYSLQKKALHRSPKWEEILVYDKDGITLTQPALLDFGAAGKGYLVDILAEILEDAEVQTYVINAGSDIRFRSEHNDALEVGLENPLDTSEAVGVARLVNASLCASAGSKRQWAGINHIINPITLKSPENIIASWVIAADTMTADGLATALFFTEPDVLLEQFSFSYALLGSDMSLQRSPDFPVKIFEAH
ncbi:MAG: FAD:protein FMN transferase [Candidatus Saccharimonadales bacterium]